MEMCVKGECCFAPMAMEMAVEGESSLVAMATKGDFASEAISSREEPIPEPMSREQGFLEAFFQAISQFAYDKAKQIAEKEKEANKTHVGSAWNSLLTILVLLAISEKGYMNLSFMGQKGFLRKDNPARSEYHAFNGELEKLIEAGRESAVDTPERFIFDIGLKLWEYTRIRKLLMLLYDRMHNLGTPKVNSCEHMFERIQNITFSHRSSEYQKCLFMLKSIFSYECETLYLLLEAQTDMEKWSFFSALTPLSTAHMRLTEWAAAAQFKESRRLSFGAGFLKPQQLPPLYQWLVKFKVYLQTKFSLYFHEVLAKQTSPQEMKYLCSKSTVDLYQKIVSFQRKSDALWVGLLYGVIEDDDFKGHGYLYPGKTWEQPKCPGEDDTHLVMLGLPAGKPIMPHFEQLLVTLEDNRLQLVSMERIQCNYDKQRLCTYIVTKIEYKIFLGIILNGKRTDKEVPVSTFIEELGDQLRVHRIFQALKPGTK